MVRKNQEVGNVPRNEDDTVNKMHEITINKGLDGSAVPGDKYLKVAVQDERVYGQLAGFDNAKSELICEKPVLG